MREILRCMATGNGHREKYPPIVRNFCITLMNTSPAAYRFARETFKDHLPSPGTIRSWYANSDLKCEPGKVMKHSLSILRRKVAEMATKGSKLIGGILFDEMAIRKHLQFVNNEMLGFETLPGKDPSKSDVASEALVFMFTAINDNIHLPVAYYFVTKEVDAMIKMSLLTTVMQAIMDCGVELVSITFDGLRTNPAMCRILGAELDVYSPLFKPCFTFNGRLVYVIFDFSHVEKLIRNYLGNHGVIYDGDNNEIKWVYFVKLLQFKDGRGLGFTHKLTQSHIQFSANPMKVKLAVQTFSASTANAMEYLMNKGYPEFAGAGPTIKFIRIFNDLFDICNSTDSSKANPLKNPMSPENSEQIFRVFEDAVIYIKGLQTIEYRKKTKLCNTQSRTGFQGYLVNIESLVELYNDKLVVDRELMGKLATHSMSQDHLEILFGKVRSLNGYNNNPTCQQFNAALSKIMANTTLLYSKLGNCTVLNSNSVCNPYSNISFITSRRAALMDDPNDLLQGDVHGAEVEVFLEQLADIQNIETGTDHGSL